MEIKIINLNFCIKLKLISIEKISRFYIIIKTALSFVRLHAKPPLASRSLFFYPPTYSWPREGRRITTVVEAVHHRPPLPFLPKEPRESLFSSSFFSDYPIDYAILPSRLVQPRCPSRSPRRFKLLMSIFRLVTLSELVHRRSCVLPIKVFNESGRKTVSPLHDDSIAIVILSPRVD